MLDCDFTNGKYFLVAHNFLDSGSEILIGSPAVSRKIINPEALSVHLKASFSVLFKGLYMLMCVKIRKGLIF